MEPPDHLQVIIGYKAKAYTILSDNVQWLNVILKMLHAENVTPIS